MTRRTPAARPARWTRDDFARPADELAPALLGRLLVRLLPGGERLAGRIVETEAYLGEEDLASHSARGRRSPRNEAMYGPPGLAYVFFTYGMHHCFNAVCGRLGEPAAVLIRALEPIEGADLMRALRDSHSRRRSPIPETDLASGPARLCQALDINRSHNGLDLARAPDLFVESPAAIDPPPRVAVGPRIGVAYAGAWAAAPLRWWLEGNPHVSR